MLEIVFDRLVRLMTTSLRNFTSDNVEVCSTGSRRCVSAIISTHPAAAILAVFKAEEWDTSASSPSTRV